MEAVLEIIVENICLKQGGRCWPDLMFVKNLHNRIFGPTILHTKSAYFSTSFTGKETA